MREKAEQYLPYNFVLSSPLDGWAVLAKLASPRLQGFHVW